MPAMHDALLNNSLSFVSLLESEELRCDLASLGYFSHWQTPSQVSQRFDTRFFVAALPPEQIPLESSYEVTHSLWLAPERAMQLHERGQLPMIFPTFVSLRTLADFETVESVLKEFHVGTVTPVSTKPSTAGESGKFISVHLEIRRGRRLWGRPSCQIERVAKAR